MEGEDDEDYGDYVTRCVCGFKHDDGYMICCDGCSVWQHLECMKIDPNHIPDKYLCEQCEPRSVDRKRARQIQVKKKESIAEALRAGKLRIAPHPEPENNDNGSSEDSRKQAASSHPSGPQSSRKKRRGKLLESRGRSDSRKRKRDDRRPAKKKVTPSRGQQSETPVTSFVTTTTVATSGLQSLLNAASLLEESTSQYLWDTDTSPWTDKYDTAELNRYSEPVRSFLSSRLSQLKTEALVYNKDDYSTIESRKPQPQCCEQRKRKGIMANSPILPDELVMEYKGKITVKHAVLSDSSVGGKSLWKHKPCPFVYLYDKISDLDLCIDARHYGNLARFIRRSCTPNAEVRHFFVASELRFGIYALKRIDCGEEITVPFDFRYEKCDYPVECACGQKASCHVVRANHAILNRKMVSKGTEEDQTGQPKHQSAVVVPTEDSNSSFASTGSRKRVTRSQQRLNMPTSPPENNHVDHFSGYASSDGEEDGCGDPEDTPTAGGGHGNGGEQQDHDDHDDQDCPQRRGKASQSREDRKNEAVWKVIEKMETSSSRRKHQLLSEDSDPVPSSPSAVPTTPIMLGPKHRHLSTGQRNTLLQCGRVRLSSVSSDPFSPMDASESFSPPITPKHVPQDLFCIPHSPLADGPRCYRSEFEASPYLHPKYLLSRFELPWKKTVLRQLEMLQYGNGMGMGLPNPWMCSYPTHRGNGKVRTRGTQKHRWLRLHADEITKALTGKENVLQTQEAEQQHKLPPKKYVLMKWERSQYTHEPPSTRLCSPPRGGDKRTSSPLFDEVSSDGEDFEMAEREGARRRIGSSSSDAHRRALSHPVAAATTAAGVCPPAANESDPSHHVGHGAVCEEEEGGKMEEAVGPRTPTACKHDAGGSEDNATKPGNNTSGCLDVGVAERGVGMEVGPKTPPPPLADLREALRGGGGGVTGLGTAPAGRDSAEESDLCVGGGCSDGTGDANRSDLFEGGGDCSFRTDEESPLSPHNKAGNQGGRKKISLGDYLKRPKKPLDQRRPPPLPAPPLDSPSTPSTSSYQSFHQTPHSVAVAPTAASSTNSYASISPTSGGTPLSSTMTPSASGSGGLQFEPVSPGEDDGTPPLVTMEDSGSLLLMSEQAQQMATTRMVPVMTVYGNQSMLVTMEQQQQPVAPVFIQQQFPGQFIPMLEARWGQGGIELSQDPRRGAIPSELFVQQTIMAPPNQEAPPLSQIHGGLLPHPVQQVGPHPLMQQGIVPQHGEVHPGLIPRPQEFLSRQRGNPHGFMPHHQHRQMFKRHSQSGFYQ